MVEVSIVQRSTWLVSLLSAVALSSACGGSSQSGSPGAPSTVASTTSASIAGTVMSAASGLSVNVAGTSIRGTVSKRGRFELSSVPAGSVALNFQGRGTNATLSVGSVKAGDQIDITVTVGSSSAHLGADMVEVKGSVSNLAGSCPDLSFSVKGKTVTTSEATEFKDGSCSDVQNNRQVEIHGASLPEGGVVATEVEIKSGDGEDEPDDPDEPDETEIKGAVDNLSGTCPSLSFTVKGASVVTDGGTRFTHTACGDLEEGDEVNVQGVLEGGVIHASHVAANNRHEPAQVKGIVENLGGSCPSLTFEVKGEAVATDGETKFLHKPCSELQAGDEVNVEGVVEDGVIQARNIEIFKDHDHGKEVEVKGTIEGLDGSCPAVTFGVNGQAVATDSQTKFKHESCSDLADGDEVEVEGILEEGVIHAKEINAK